MSSFDAGANFDPVDHYREGLEEKCRQAANDLFESNLKASGVSEAKNEADYQKYLKLAAKSEEAHATLSKFVGLRIFLWVLFAIGLAAGIAGLALSIVSYTLGALLACLIGFLSAVAFLLLILLVLNRKVAEARGAADRAKKKADAQRSLIESELYPLRSLFRWNDFKKVAAMTTKMFTLDEKLPEDKVNWLRNVYAFTDVLGDTQSVVSLMSGDIHGNPYVRLLAKSEAMVDKTYSGSITISWTEYYTDSEGHRRSTVRTQVLTAYYTHPAPSFSEIPVTLYGNLAAPDLSFSRRPSGHGGDDEKALKRFVEKQEKALRDRSEEAISKGGSFQPLANTEFEALFGAYDRDHEVQFRLLMTPLAQQNFVELIRGKAGYGDDFTFKKQKTLNMVQTYHSSQYFRYFPGFCYAHLSIKLMRQAFIDLMANLFKSLYFDLAPFMCIPLYQTTEGGHYTPKRAFGRDISDYEAMRTVNQMDASRFMPEGSTTDQILKTVYRRSIGTTDFFSVESLAFEAVPMVIYIPTSGGDGRIHDVPVHYFDYQERRKSTDVAVRRADEEAEKFDGGPLRSFLKDRNGAVVNSYAAYFPLSALDGGDEASLDAEEKAFENFFLPLENLEKGLEELDKKGDEKR